MRFKRQGVYQLAPVASLGLPPAVPQPTLVLQVSRQAGQGNSARSCLACNQHI